MVGEVPDCHPTRGRAGQFEVKKTFNNLKSSSCPFVWCLMISAWRSFNCPKLLADWIRHFFGRGVIVSCWKENFCSPVAGMDYLVIWSKLKYTMWFKNFNCAHFTCPPPHKKTSPKPHMGPKTWRSTLDLHSFIFSFMFFSLMNVIRGDYVAFLVNTTFWWMMLNLWKLERLQYPLPHTTLLFEFAGKLPQVFVSS